MKKIIILGTLFCLSVFLFVGFSKKAQGEAEISFGAESVFNTASSSSHSLAKLSSNKAVLGFRDGAGGFNLGTAVIADIPGNSVSFGQKYIFNDSPTDFISLVPLSEDKFAAVFSNGGDENKGTVIIGSISGDTVSFGQKYIFESSSAKYISAVFLSKNKFLIAYQDGNGGVVQGKIIVATVDNSTVSFSSDYVFNSAKTNYISLVLLSEDKFVIAYGERGVSDMGVLILGRVSEDGIAFGSEYVFSYSQTEYISVAKINENMLLVAYRDNGAGLGYGKAILGNVSDLVVDLGEKYTFNEAGTKDILCAGVSENKAVIVYQDSGDSSYGKVIVADVLDNEINLSDEYIFNSGYADYVSTAQMSAENILFAYHEQAQGVHYGRGLIGVLPVEKTEEIESPEEAEQPAEEERNIVDGDLIRNPNAEGMAQFDIYIVKLIGSKKFKRLILSPHVFESYGHLSWNNVQDVSQSTMDEYTTSDLVREINDTKVYQLTADGDTGTKTEKSSYDIDAVYTINKTDFDSYK